MSTDPSDITALVERVTGLTARTSALIDTGAEHQVLEVNGEWIFRLPRQRPSRPNERTRRDFLAAFAKRSPIAVPDEVLNRLWFCEARQDREGIARAIERLRRSLDT